MDRDAAGGRRRRRRITYLSILGIMLLLHVLAWNSERFCDWYAAHVFRIWVETYGRAMGMVPFSVGEALIGLGLGFGALGGALGLIWLAGRMSGPGEGRKQAEARGGARERRRGRKDAPPERPGALRSFSRAYCTGAMWILLTVFVLMTLNSAILYHTSGFGEKYLEAAAAEYGLEELEALRNFVVEQCNTLCCRIPRNEDGSISYGGDMAEAARAAMGELGTTYSGLDGFYPAPKPLRCSDFLSRRYIAGCFYPFSMEANYNDVMHILNFPSTMCHELAHLRGYIYEDEANFIGYLACVQSDDAFFQYAGYLSVLVYLYNDIYKAWKENETVYAEAVARIRPVKVEDQVWTDNVFVVQEEWDRINGKALIDTEVVDKAADAFIDTNLKVNGVSDGAVSYSRVVKLLLQYYRYHPLAA